MTEYELTTGLYQALKEQDEPRVMERWHASSIAQCPRAQFLQRKGVTQLSRPTGANILRWRAGHLIEESIRPELQKLYPNLISNVRYTSEKLDVTGEIDNYDPDSKTIIEIKSVGPRAVRNRRVAEDRHHLRDDRQYLHHEWQEHTYVPLMAESKLEVEQITYLYITLEGLLVPYLTDVNPDILNDVNNRIIKLNEYWAKNVLPPCYCSDSEHPFARSVMQYCPYKDEANGRCCDESLL